MRCVDISIIFRNLPKLRVLQKSIDSDLCCETVEIKMILNFLILISAAYADWLPWSKCLSGKDTEPTERTVARCGTDVISMDQSDGRKTQVFIFLSANLSYFYIH